MWRRNEDGKTKETFIKWGRGMWRWDEDGKTKEKGMKTKDQKEFPGGGGAGGMSRIISVFKLYFTLKLNLVQRPS